MNWRRARPDLGFPAALLLAFFFEALLCFGLQSLLLDGGQRAAAPTTVLLQLQRVIPAELPKPAQPVFETPSPEIIEPTPVAPTPLPPVAPPAAPEPAPKPEPVPEPEPPAAPEPAPEPEPEPKPQPKPQPKPTPKPTPKPQKQPVTPPLTEQPPISPPPTYLLRKETVTEPTPTVPSQLESRAGEPLPSATPESSAIRRSQQAFAATATATSTPFPTAPTPTPSPAAQRQITRYLGEVTRRLQGLKRYPRNARAGNESGTLLVEFRISHTGTPHHVEIFQQHCPLLAAYVKERVSGMNFAKPPPEWDPDALIRITLKFVLY